MSSGPGFEIKNCTQWPLTVSLEQIGPLYYGLVQPGETFVRDTGAVWFTIRAVVSPDNVSHIDDWNCILPIAAVVGAVLFAAITGGTSAFLAVGASVGATALAAGGAVSLGAIVVEGAAGGAVATALSASTAAKLLGDLFAKSGAASRDGMYAGPPWPFNDDRKQLSIVGGPVASVTTDGKMLLSPGTSLDIVDHFQPIPYTAPIISNWVAMPGSFKTMSMIRRGLMMALDANGNISSWDGTAWTSVAGTLASISAGADGTVWGVNSSNQVFKWGGQTWTQIANTTLKHVAVGSASMVWGINMTNQVCVYNGSSFINAPTTWASYLAGSNDGTLLHIGRGNCLYRTDPVSGGAFQPRIDSNTQMDQISVGNVRSIWGISGGKVYRRNWTGNWVGTWTQVNTPENFLEVTASLDGAVCGIGVSNTVYTYNGT